jgi:hydrogenase expression/formation protein HypE
VSDPNFQLSCPLPIRDTERVLLAHGGGGRLSHRLIAELFHAAFDDEALVEGHDSAVVEFDAGRLAMTTDSYVVRPLEFPGGDLGQLAIAGTVNALAMAGARPRFVSVGFILEEGLPVETLWRIVRSMRIAADAAGVRIVTGDTKVVEKGAGDGIYINTTGVGTVDDGIDVRPARVRADDVVICSGDVGRHGIAIMAEREGLGFQTTIESDAALLHEVAGELVSAVDVHCLRDLTRGGLASATVEIAGKADVEIRLSEEQIAVDDAVRGACEMLGLDPMHVASEGRFVAFVPREQADEALRVMRKYDVASAATIVGTVHRVDRRSRVVATNAFGGRRVVEMFRGEQLPRIC